MRERKIRGSGWADSISAGTDDGICHTNVDVTFSHSVDGAVPTSTSPAITGANDDTITFSCVAGQLTVAYYVAADTDNTIVEPDVTAMACA